MSTDNAKIVDREDGLVAACECGRLVPLRQRTATRKEGVGYRQQITGIATCFIGTCGCGQVFKTRTDVFKRDQFGRMVLISGDNGPEAGKDGVGDTQEAAGGLGGPRPGC